MAYQKIEVSPIAGALGAEIDGVDLSEPLDNATFADIHQALLDHLVIFFHDQHLTPEQHKAFGRRFGTLNIHPYVRSLKGHPEIIEVIKETGGDRHWGESWHSDLSFKEKPTMGAILYAREVPPWGGDTMFANTYLAYETLSDGMKRMLEDLKAVHSSGDPKHFSDHFKAMYEKQGEREETVHPVLRTHPETGRKALYVNSVFTERFADMTETESQPLLSYLYDHLARPEFTCRFHWRDNSIAFWDNRITQHMVVSDHHDELRGDANGYRRVMNRVTIDGDRPF